MHKKILPWASHILRTYRFFYYFRNGISTLSGFQALKICEVYYIYSISKSEEVPIELLSMDQSIFS